MYNKPVPKNPSVEKLCMTLSAVHEQRCTSFSVAAAANQSWHHDIAP